MRYSHKRTVPSSIDRQKKMENDPYWSPALQRQLGDVQPYAWLNAGLDASLGQSMLDYPVTTFAAGTAAASSAFNQLPGVGVLGFLAFKALALPASVAAGGLVVSGVGAGVGVGVAWHTYQYVATVERLRKDHVKVLHAEGVWGVGARALMKEHGFTSAYTDKLLTMWSGLYQGITDGANTFPNITGMKNDISRMGEEGVTSFAQAVQQVHGRLVAVMRDPERQVQFMANPNPKGRQELVYIESEASRLLAIVTGALVPVVINTAFDVEWFIGRQRSEALQFFQQTVIQILHKSSPIAPLEPSTAVVALTDSMEKALVSPDAGLDALGAVVLWSQVETEISLPVDDPLLKALQASVIWMSDVELWKQTLVATSGGSLDYLRKTLLVGGAHSAFSPEVVAQLYTQNPMYEEGRAAYERCLPCLAYISAMPEHTMSFPTLPITLLFEARRVVAGVTELDFTATEYDPKLSPQDNALAMYPPPMALINEVMSLLQNITPPMYNTAFAVEYIGELAKQTDPGSGETIVMTDRSAAEAALRAPWFIEAEYWAQMIAGLPSDLIHRVSTAMVDAWNAFVVQATSLQTMGYLATTFAIYSALPSPVRSVVEEIVKDVAKGGIRTWLPFFIKKLLWLLRKLFPLVWLTRFALKALPREHRRSREGLALFHTMVDPLADDADVDELEQQWSSEDEDKAAEALSSLQNKRMEELAAKVHLLNCSVPQVVAQRTLFASAISRTCAAFKGVKDAMDPSELLPFIRFASIKNFLSLSSSSSNEDDLVVLLALSL